MMNSFNLTQQLANFGLNKKQIELYLSLIKEGTLTPLELSRSTRINRTTIYRLLEDLNKLGLVEEILDQHRIKYQVVDPKKLKVLLIQKELALKKQQAELPELIKQLSLIHNQPSSSTQVKYFRGKEGLKQMLWNVTEAKSGFSGFGYGDWNDSVGKKFAEKLRQRVVEKKLISREIQNEDQVDKVMTYTSIKHYDQYHESRIIPKSVVEINHDTYIYDGVFAFYHFYEGQLFGVEIHNQEIAKTQQQIFQVLWQQAKKI